MAQRTPADQPVGKDIGTYELLSQLGAGAASEVWRARGEDGTVVALKVVPRSRVEFHTRLQTEYQALTRIDHPGVVGVIDHGSDTQRSWLALQLVEGQALDQWAAALPSSEHATTVLAVGADLARALDAVHRAGFVHQDLKPANVLVDAQGRPRILDLGLAAKIDDPGDHSGAAGSLRYMAPEQLTATEVDLRADLFALGVILYELLSGVSTHDSTDRVGRILAQCRDVPIPLATRCPDLPRTATQLIDRLLAKSPADRPRSASVVARRLLRALGEPPPDEQQTLPLAAMRPRFVGRQGMVDTLRRQVMTGQTGTWILRGAQGIGLSRLLRELRAEVLLRGGRHALLTDARDPLGQLLDILVGHPMPTSVRNRLLADDAAAVLAAWPHLDGSTDRWGRPVGRVPANALRRVLTRATLERPFFVAVDDADQLGPSVIPLLHGRVALVLATHSSLPDLSGAHQLQVPPLTPAQLAEAARSMIDDAGPALAWAHAGSLGGRPGALAELLRSWTAPTPARRARPSGAHSGDLGWPQAVRRAETDLALVGAEAALVQLARPDTPTPPAGVLRHDIELLKARSCYQLGRHESALAHAARAGEVAESPPQRHAARRESARVAIRLGYLDPAIVEVQRGSADALAAGLHDELMRWTALGARAAMLQGALHEAERWLARARPTKTTPAARLGWNLSRAQVALRQARWQTAKEAVEATSTVAVLSGSGRVQAALHLTAAHLHQQRGEVARGWAQVRIAQVLLEGHGDLQLEAHVGLLAAVLGRATGHDEHAQTSLDRAATQVAFLDTPQLALELLDVRLKQAKCDDIWGLFAEVDQLPGAWLELPTGAALLATAVSRAVGAGDSTRARAWIRRLPSAPVEDLAIELAISAARAEAAGDDAALAALCSRSRELGLHYLHRVHVARWGSPSQREQALQDAQRTGDHAAVRALDPGRL